MVWIGPHTFNNGVQFNTNVSIVRVLRQIPGESLCFSQGFFLVLSKLHNSYKAQTKSLIPLNRTLHSQETQ
jgi:hypothetical protein